MVILVWRGVVGYTDCILSSFLSFFCGLLFDRCRRIVAAYMHADGEKYHYNGNKSAVISGYFERIHFAPQNFYEHCRTSF